jgi:hypothetical protein
MRSAPLAAALIALGMTGAAVSAQAPLGARLADAATRLLQAMSESERRAAHFAFADAEREDLHYAPLFLDGARHDELSSAAAARLDDLLTVALSPTGLEKVRQIRALEPAVARKERGRALGLGRLAARLRDPGRYFVALFGEPGEAAPWGLRYEGHHVSLNLTLAPGGAPASTPLFLGAEPRRVPEGWPAAGIQALRAEEEGARALYSNLSSELRRRATLEFAGDRALMLGEVRRVSLSGQVGVARGELPPAAQAQLDGLVESFLVNLAPPLAAARRAEIEAAGRDELRFAWAESAEPPGAFYWRIQGPRTLIEVDNTSDGDHVHAVWHDTAGDFGDDLLAAHYREVHGVALSETLRESREP